MKLTNKIIFAISVMLLFTTNLKTLTQWINSVINPPKYKLLAFNDTSLKSMGEKPYLTYDDLLALLSNKFHTNDGMLSILNSRGDKWINKGKDKQLGEIIYQLTSPNQGMLDWHYKIKLLEYITFNKYNYQSIISELSSQGYLKIQDIATSDDHTTTYSNNLIYIQIIQVKLSTGRIAYKILLKSK